MVYANDGMQLKTILRNEAAKDALGVSRFSFSDIRFDFSKQD